MTRQIQIYDTTLRDGTQGEGVSLSLQDKLEIAKRLDEIGVDYIEGGYPLSNEKDQQFFQKVQQLGLQHAQICAFGMTRRRGVAADVDPGMLALRDSQAPICTIVGKTWDFHVTDVLRVELAENLEMIGDSISFLVAEGREVIYDAEHYFDGTKANAEYAAQTIQAAAEAGASLIVLCDTNGGSLPEEITAMTAQAIELLAQWSVPVGIHCHNDCDVAIANSLAAVDAGAVQVQGTINGIGERCGNADLISVIANLTFKKDGWKTFKKNILINDFREKSQNVAVDMEKIKMGVYRNLVYLSFPGSSQLDLYKTSLKRKLIVGLGLFFLAGYFTIEGINNYQDYMDYKQGYKEAKSIYESLSELDNTGEFDIFNQNAKFTYDKMEKSYNKMQRDVAGVTLVYSINLIDLIRSYYKFSRQF